MVSWRGVSRWGGGCREACRGALLLEMSGKRFRLSGILRGDSLLPRGLDGLGLVVVLLLVNGSIDQLSVARVCRHPGARGVRRLSGGAIIGSCRCRCACAALVQDQGPMTMSGGSSTDAMLVAATSAEGVVCVVMGVRRSVGFDTGDEVVRTAVVGRMVA